MIHKTNHRSNAGHQPSQGSDAAIEQWGQWWGRKYYSLEVIQHPLRARMCGFGDKDRRPLAPAAVAKMVVRKEDNSIVDVEDIDCSFFLVTVDLWSADGKREMNLVLHPSSSTDRYVATNAQKSRKPRSTNPPSSPNHEHSPTSSHSTPNSVHQQPRLPVSTMTPMVPTPPSTYANQSYPYPHQAQIPDNMSYDDQDPYGSPSDSNSAWGYTPSGPPIDRTHGFQNQPHPSMSSYTRNGIRNGIPAAAPGEPWQGQSSSYRTESDSPNYRNWPAAEPSYPALVNPQTNVYAGQEVDPSIRHSEPITQQSEASNWPQQPVASDSSPRYGQEPFQGTGNSFDHPQVYGGTSQTPYYQSNYAQSSSSSPPATNHPLPRNSYTRTLVGPLSSNACRLLDEHRKPGIFFLFQDLSVRTEGTFRLRLRLMNVGEPPAPEAGSMRVHTNVSPVLAQTFTEPFVVFSAKRFPGVPDTTALSIAFGNQGQKLPLRNRHGTSKHGRRRRDGDSDVSDESDDT